MAKNTKKKSCGNCVGCGSCDEAARIQQRIFEREVDEELQQERLAHLWRRYRWLIIGGIILVVGSAVGYEAHKSWWQKTRLSESDRYEAAVFNAYTGQAEQAVTQLDALSETGKTGYRYLAQLESAGILFSMDKKQDALAILQDVMNNTKAPSYLRSVATLSFVGHQIEDGNSVELQHLLTPLMMSDNASFSASAAELSALLSLQSDDKVSAVRVIEQALSSEKIPLPIRERLTYLLAEAQK